MVSGDIDARPATSGTRRALARIDGWKVAGITLALLLFAPVAAVFVAAAQPSDGLWPHLVATVLPRYIANTLILMLGVGALSVAFGVTTAWVVFRYDFAGRRILEWCLLLPAAVPAYIVAYTLTDFLEFAGPVQGALRDLFGWRSARDYWFPDIRSMGGAILVMGGALYPYVYIMVRTAFMQTPSSLFEVSEIYGRRLSTSVAIPLARPALVAGLALVLMETISDFGTVEYFSIETLTLGIFNVWLGQDSLPAAAQISIICFLFIVALLIVEQLARARKLYGDTTGRARTLRRERVTGTKAMACIAICLLPISIGFILPVGVLLSFVVRGYSIVFDVATVAAMGNALLVAGSVAALVMATAMVLGIVATYRGGSRFRLLTRFASAGYAFPGTILAIGVVTAAGLLDAGFARMATVLGLPGQSGLLTGTVALVIIACAVRFQAIGYGAVNSGLGRLPGNMMAASRSLGRTFFQSVREVIAPLLWRTLIAGGLLVFVDVMKELPMTLLLRPFNFDTLATYVYQFAKDELLEEAALPALMIVATGLIPVIVMNTALDRLTRR
ncbi:MAG: iron ABC transporter permease [Pseudomonadota bacterium]